MRKILIILILAITSCEGSLDLEPKMFISADKAFSNRENLYAALLGCYDALQLQHYYGRNLVIVGDLASDNSRATGTKIEYYSADENSLLSDNILVEGIWTDIYTAINRVNYILDKLDEIEFLSAEEKNDFLGQLSFLRALHYFNLVRLYGEVPLKTTPTKNAEEENSVGRSPVDQVYELIVSDLGIAILNIQNQEKDKATAIAAKSLLSLVFLTRGSYVPAYNYSREVYDSVSYLEDNFSELFAAGSEPSPEILFYVPFNPNDKNRLAEYHLPNQLGGRYENSPTTSLISLIEENDQRKDMIASWFKGKYYSAKYSDLTTGADKVIVLRAAEMLFVMAEAAYRIDSIGNLEDIAANINTIRSRAGLTAASDLSPGSIWKYIETERQLEFAFEGKRWFDLIRTGRALQVIPSVTSEYQTLFPIPLSEILANPMIGIEDQNEGY